MEQIYSVVKNRNHQYFVPIRLYYNYVYFSVILLNYNAICTDLDLHVIYIKHSHVVKQCMGKMSFTNVHGQCNSCF